MLHPSRTARSRPAARVAVRESLLLACPPPTRIATLGALRALAVGLFLALAGEASAQTQLFETTHAMFPADSDAGSGAALGDVDGDGDLDAFLGSLAGLGERLLRNDGLARFTVDPTALPMTPSTTQDAAFGDVDGDGDLDLLLGSGSSLDPNRLFRNDGTGVFTDAPQNLPHQNFARTQEVGLADLDGDADLDVVWVQFSGTPWMWSNDGSGVFSDATANLPVTQGLPSSIAIGDADGDLDPDLALGIAFGAVLLYVNDGAAVFTDQAGAFPPTEDQVTAVAFGDVDGDGDLDLYAGIAAQFGQHDHLYRNQGAGMFSDASTNLPENRDTTNDLALADFDGDQDLDVLTANGRSATAMEEFYRNDGTGTFTDASDAIPQVDDSTLDIAAGDLDGDQDLDVVLVNAQDEQDRLWLGDGAGNFTDVDAPLPPAVDTTTEFAAGDVDGDGDLDLFAGTIYGANQSTGPDRLFLNDGVGNFTDATGNIPFDKDRTFAVALGDVDGDGDLDVWEGVDNGSVQGGLDRLLQNDGSGVFTDASASIPQISDPSRDVALADVDADGDLDAFLGNVGPFGGAWEPRLALNRGDGFFIEATATHLPPDPLSCNAVALGDVDGDGDLDAWLATNGQDQLYANDGTGMFTEATFQLPQNADTTRRVHLADLDGDQDLDAWAVQVSAHTLFRNAGGGIFQTSSSSIPASLTASSDADLADVDGDGDLDAYLGGGRLWNPLPDQLALNDGTGTFTDASTRVPRDLEPTSDVALADLDGDGDPDVVIGSTNQQDRFHRNLSRQLSWRHLPRLGNPLLLDVNGPAGGPYVLLVSPAPSSTLTPYGTLRLSPAGLLVAATETLGGQGHALLTLPLVPSQPGLAGLSLYWQALVGLPAGLTNLEITTFTIF